MSIDYFQLLIEHQTQLITIGSPQQVDPGIFEILKLAIGTKAK